MQTVTSEDGDENQGRLAGTSVPSPVLQQTSCWTRKTTLPPEFPYERKGLTGKSRFFQLEYSIIQAISPFIILSSKTSDT